MRSVYVARYVPNTLRYAYANATLCLRKRYAHALSFLRKRYAYALPRRDTNI